jgi:flagellin
MSVLINTNAAATLAANNLAASNGLLQRSLNRLSSGSKIVNPADDAGGLAVSMKLSATARRQGATLANLGNSVSYLQSQDGVLKTAGKVLERIGELKTLYLDPTKNADDKANYNAEFTALQSELSSLAAEKFNGIALFGSTALSVNATGESGGSTIAVGGADLLGSAAAPFAAFSDSFADLTNWTDSSSAGASTSVSGNVLDLFGSSGFSVLTTNDASFSGAFSITLDVRFSGATDNLQVSLGGDSLVNISQFDVGDNNWHSVRIDFDGSGGASSYLDGSGTAFDTQTGIGATSGAIELFEMGFDHTYVRDFAISSTAASGASTNDVATAASLDALDLASITSSLQEIATFRAENGAQQSRLGYASEVLATNKANLEAANSRIVDVDVASESTQLARYNILVQAGTSMLAQANQSAQSALRLLN